MIIRNEQLEVMRTSELASFKEALANHVYEYGPEIGRIVGLEGRRNIAALALARSKAYGFTRSGPIHLYTELMLSLGSSFDSDPALPWAREVLLRGGEADQLERASQLFNRAMDYLDAVAGPENRFALAACDRAVRALHANSSPTGQDEEIMRGIREVYPEKCTRCDDAALASIIAAARRTSAQFGNHRPPAIALMAGLLFGFGYGVMEDPAYPWIRRTLTDTLVADPNDRIERLRQKVAVYVAQILKNHGGTGNA